MAQLDFAGKVVVVTGASRGVGLEVARQFGEHGASLGLIAREPDTLAHAASQLGGTRVLCAPADVADESQVIQAFSRIEEALGVPDVLVNNAGHGTWGAVVATDAATFKNAIDVNFLGAVHSTAQVLGPMMQRGSGHIVNVASIAGRIGAPFEAAYSASKFALVGYTEALSAELDGSGVSVSLITAGPVDTEFAERRGHAYDKARPRPVSPARVASDVVAAASRGHREQFTPKWLRFAHGMKTVIPAAHRLGVRRMFAEERRELHRRIQ